jgi:shikimate kinase
VLAGFMGAGKSTVGPLLAQALGWRFADLDHVIEIACAKPVAEIFRDHGEAYFRQREKEAAERMRNERSIVLALGGGTLEDPETLSTLLSSAATCMVFLDAPLPELLARIQDGDSGNGGDGGDEVRPLLRRQEELQARHRRRLPHYRAAHFTVVTSGLQPHEVAERILSHVRQRWLV